VTTHEFDLLAVGRPSVDLIFSGLSDWPRLGLDVDAAGLGACAGTSFNTPAAAHRLGLRVGYIALVGNDSWSQVVLREFEAEGLPTDFLRIADHPLPFVSVALNQDHDRGFVTFYEAAPEDDADLARHALEVLSTVRARHFHAYAGEEPSDLIAVARERGMTVSLDAWGGPFWEAPATLSELVSGADILLANEAEALAMTGVRDLHEAIRQLSALCRCVAVKRGSRGAMAVMGSEFVEAAPEPADVLDATGAGDCFNAGFLYGWLAGRSLTDCLVLGNICGACAVQAYGGYRGCPSRHELARIAATRGISLTRPSFPEAQ
jgi:sugar/nucleoside kinase (ribokinase family)